MLLDPDKIELHLLPEQLKRIESAGVDFLFVGGSLVDGITFNEVVTEIKKHSSLPVVIFPGSSFQISESADAILFLSLISGRNPEYLIGQQVIAAPYIKRLGLPSIATGYILVDCGSETTASYISNTKPIPYNKPQIAAATALAGEMLGHDIMYLDGGSGAKMPISGAIISQVKSTIDIPLIVGGGIRTKEAIVSAFSSGANVVVIGTAIEESEGFLNEIASIKHSV